MEKDVNESSVMSFYDFVLLIKRNIIMVILLVFGCAVLGFIGSRYFDKTVFTATATAIVVVDEENLQRAGEETNFNYSNSLSLINTFKDFITSNLILKKTCENLKEIGYNNVTISSLENNVRVSTSTSSLLIKVSFKSQNEEEAKAYVNEILKTAIDVANKDFVTENGTKPLSNKLVALDYATNTIESNKTSIILVLAVSIGLVMSLLIILVGYFLDDTYTSKEIFERDNKIKVIVMLPEYEGEIENAK